MARKSHHIATPAPVLALGQTVLALGMDDTLAYYTKAPAAGCQLREIDAIEQMYGYYNVEKARRSSPVLPKLN